MISPPVIISFVLGMCAWMLIQIGIQASIDYRNNKANSDKIKKEIIGIRKEVELDEYAY